MARLEGPHPQPSADEGGGEKTWCRRLTRDLRSLETRWTVRLMLGVAATLTPALVAVKGAVEKEAASTNWVGCAGDPSPNAADGFCLSPRRG